MSGVQSVLSALGLCLVLTACQPGLPPEQTQTPPPDIVYSAGSVLRIGSDATRGPPLFTDKTVVTYDKGHGTQVTFHARDGRSYLWYPGNTKAVPARWKIDTQRSVESFWEYMNAWQVCYRYPSTSVNGVTGERGGTWECAPSTFYLTRVQQILDGDPFNLRSGAVPAVAPRDKRKRSAGELAARAGIDPSQMRITAAFEHPR